MPRRRKRDVVAEARRFNAQSSYTRSWQVSPVGETNRLRLRGASSVLLRIVLYGMAGILLLVPLLAVFEG